jgi:hypothetical protein
MAYLENEIRQAQALHDRKQEALKQVEEIRPLIDQLSPHEEEASRLQHDIQQDTEQASQQGVAAQQAQQAAAAAQGKADAARTRLNQANALAARKSDIEAAAAAAEAEIKELTRLIALHRRPSRPHATERRLPGGDGGNGGGTDGGDGGDGGDTGDDPGLQDLIDQRTAAQARLDEAKRQLAEIQLIPTIMTEVSTADHQAGESRTRANDAQRAADETARRLAANQGRLAALQPALQQLAGLRAQRVSAEQHATDAHREELARWPELTNAQDGSDGTTDPLTRLIGLRDELTRGPMNRTALAEGSLTLEAMLRGLQQQLREAERRADIAANMVRQAQDYLKDTSEFSRKNAELAQRQSELDQFNHGIAQAVADRDAAWKELQERGGNLGRLKR